MENEIASVLVIEHHPMMLESLCAAIAAEPDLQVALPSPGSADAFPFSLNGMEDVLFLAGKPDIVLLALGNPGLEDLKALDALRELWDDTPILALTLNESSGLEEAALAHGAKAVLTKSASRVELLQALRTLKPTHLPFIDEEKLC